MRAVALTIAWIVGIIYAVIPSYWLTVHPFTDYWRRRPTPHRILVPLWGVMMVMVGAITWPWRLLQLYQTWASWLALPIFVAVGAVIYRRTRGHFKREQLLGRTQLEPSRFEQRLVTTGMHSRIRHPFYLGHLCMLLGWTVASGLLVLYVLSGFAIISGWINIVLEERELERRFGDQFREYKRRVPALLPLGRKVG